MRIIRALSEKKLSPIRLGFSRYLVEHYGMSMSTAYQKIRLNRVRRWEAEGVEKCLRDFSPCYEGKLEDFFPGLPHKKEFIEFMNTRGMGEHACRTHFRNFDFTEVEIRGLEAIYKEYRKQMEEV